MAIKKLFEKRLTVINIGLELFNDTLKKQGVKTLHVNWRPPAGGDKKLAQLLEKVK
jgi:hypothetical protein